MKRLVLSALLALCASFASLTATMADSISVDMNGKVERSTTKCGADVMFVYDLPRNNEGTIVFARSYDLETGKVHIDESKIMRTSGSEICLPAGTGNVHRLRLGTETEIDLPSQEAVETFVIWLEGESSDEAKRVMDAYGIKQTASN
jgi:hypothetical protein